ncbi:addiction module antitoxin [Pseudanabaena sp. SR411]|uniref:type II toxin-antitoxin system RelE family toxin n=1 Tax=Pseudanabaena sp. SR411 TaxID=1980935 RepID=UPI000B9953B2|nr:type II toxin-antitoxin system RelE/ParE family toxin [Pseudanabaena sp. SR411]OYQ63778.1 addiction module antitoxin [Pseudanabaena sp. SR411]
MTYAIIVTKSIQKDLDNLPNEIQDRVYAKISQLSDNPRPDGVTKLKGYENEYRVRIGDYRVRYEILDENKTVLLLQCKHRREVYRNS